MADGSRIDGRRSDTRALLLAAARQLVQGENVESLKIQEVTESAKVGLGTFYNYFDSKQELLEALLGEIGREFEQYVSQLRGNLKDPAMLMAAILKLCCREARTNDDWYKYQRLLGRVPLRPLLPSLESFLADVEAGAKMGRFRPGNPQIATSMLLGALRQVCDEIRAGRLDEAQVQESVRCLLRLLGIADPVSHALAQSPIPPLTAQRPPALREAVNRAR